MTTKFVDNRELAILGLADDFGFDEYDLAYTDEEIFEFACDSEMWDEIIGECPEWDDDDKFAEYLAEKFSGENLAGPHAWQI